MDLTELRAEFEKMSDVKQMESSWNKIYSFILLPEPRRGKNFREENCRTSPWQE